MIRTIEVSAVFRWSTFSDQVWNDGWRLVRGTVGGSLAMAVHQTAVARLRSRRHRRDHQRRDPIRAGEVYDARSTLRRGQCIERRLRDFSAELCHAVVCWEMHRRPTMSSNSVTSTSAWAAISVMLYTQTRQNSSQITNTTGNTILFPDIP